MPQQKHTYNTNKVYTDARIITDEDLPQHLQSAVKNANGKQLSIFNDEILPEKEEKKYNLIGQLFDTYWLIEYDKSLYIMDQHAAHEKIKYEQLMKNFKNKEILSQQLMPPLIVTVTYQERETVLEYYDLFMNIGYDIVEFGGNEFKINAVPSNLYGISEKALFMEFVSSLMENTGYVSNDIFIRKLSTMACKSAIKGNTHITYQEADNLVKQLFELENPYTCPHGRPTIISMTEAEIEKKFRRIV
jgi:DNA mismatch repair protein MutL